MALQWTSEFPTSVVFHQRGLESVEAVHGHDGRTRIEWVEAYRGDFDRIQRRLHAIERAISANTLIDVTNQETTMANFDQIHAEVEANSDAVDSAVALLNDLSARLIDAADDPEEIAAIATELAGQSTRLAEAVVANTPAAPEPSPQPEPEPASVDEGDVA